MPYIKPAVRREVDPLIAPIIELVERAPDVGTLNYIITKILLATKPERYAAYNSLIGVLECAKLELYRRAVVPYEDRKKEENGDVY